MKFSLSVVAFFLLGESAWALQKSVPIECVGEISALKGMDYEDFATECEVEKGYTLAAFSEFSGGNRSGAYKEFSLTLQACRLVSPECAEVLAPVFVEKLPVAVLQERCQVPVDKMNDKKQQQQQPKHDEPPPVKKPAPPAPAPAKVPIRETNQTQQQQQQKQQKPAQQQQTLQPAPAKAAPPLSSFANQKQQQQQQQQQPKQQPKQQPTQNEITVQVVGHRQPLPVAHDKLVAPATVHSNGTIAASLRGTKESTNATKGTNKTVQVSKAPTPRILVHAARSHVQGPNDPALRCKAALRNIRKLMGIHVKYAQTDAACKTQKMASSMEKLLRSLELRHTAEVQIKSGKPAAHGALVAQGTKHSTLQDGFEGCMNRVIVKMFAEEVKAHPVP